LVRGVNTFLPESVAVLWARPVDADFHARYSALGAHLSLPPHQSCGASGAAARHAGCITRPLDLDAMAKPRVL